MRFMYESAAAQIVRRAKAWFGTGGDEVHLHRRLTNLVAKGRADTGKAASRRPAIQAPERSVDPLYDQSVYGSVKVGIHEDIA